MSDPQPHVEWVPRSLASAINMSLKTIVSILDGVDSSHTHIALRDARDKLDQEASRFNALIVSINNNKMDDVDAGNKLENLSHDIPIRAKPLGEVIHDKDLLAKATVAFVEDIQKRFKEIYETYPKAVSKYLTDLHKD